ncbi:shikimate kinase [Colwellia sp. M166]|uniref:shikimate kinase n=1 Tax=Colwellia sp. M166 TaxID=2583805 RepID=UPI00211E62E5|nr:shikimate kinase [Colwellia sp. M166]UUO25153.1 shikimate kinase [Colwellia sp. M166]|tara:strand:+ start:250 stop:762 length:513 start_codon:yes stop_codon:yes gene_type:complete
MQDNINHAKKIVIFGNSASGKSSLAKKLAKQEQLAHLDLDTLAWLPAVSLTSPPQRQRIDVSVAEISVFISQHQDWVIEGCYSDLLTYTLTECSAVIFLNLPIALCIENAKNRPWESHKYESKAAQDANLTMLIDWIAQYENRIDSFSKAAHQQLFDGFAGKKTQYINNQ